MQAAATADIAIVGGGIVGSAAARQLQLRWPHLRCLLLEKENRLAYHQSGRNSGVVHAGIYYQPGSLKAQLCVRGVQLLYGYCDEHGIEYRRCGKLIVATDSDEAGRLRDIYQRGISNRVPGLRFLESKEQIQEIEPHCVGVAAVHSPNTGIVDYAAVTQSLAKQFVQLGGSVQCGFTLNGVHYDSASTAADHPLRLTSTNGDSVNCRYLVTCAGLQSDRVSQLTHSQSAEQQQHQHSAKIIPFRGDYLLLKQQQHHLIRGNIYPVPDPRFPFLGVHFTPRMDGSVWLGPTAALALKREGYGRFDFDAGDAIDAGGSAAVWRLLLRNVRPGMRELHRVLSVAATVRALQKFVPELRVEDVVRGASGVRAQAVSRDGRLLDDFLLETHVPNVLHVCNAPSPAATSSLAIAEFIAEKAAQHFVL